MVISLRSGNWSVIFETPLYLDDLPPFSRKVPNTRWFIFPATGLEYQGKLDGLDLDLGCGKANLAYLRPHQVLGCYA